MSGAVISSSVKNQVESVLFASADFRSRVQCVQTDGGKIILKGNVSSFFLKQRAQEMIRKLNCVERILNELEVG